MLVIVITHQTKAMSLYSLLAWGIYLYGCDIPTLYYSCIDSCKVSQAKTWRSLQLSTPDLSIGPSIDPSIPENDAPIKAGNILACYLSG